MPKNPLLARSRISTDTLSRSSPSCARAFCTAASSVLPVASIHFSIRLLLISFRSGPLPPLPGRTPPRRSPLPPPQQVQPGRGRQRGPGQGWKRGSPWFPPGGTGTPAEKIRLWLPSSPWTSWRRLSPPPGAGARSPPAWPVYWGPGREGGVTVWVIHTAPGIGTQPFPAGRSDTLVQFPPHLDAAALLGGLLLGFGWAFRSWAARSWASFFRRSRSSACFFRKERRKGMLANSLSMANRLLRSSTRPGRQA